MSIFNDCNVCGVMTWPALGNVTELCDTLTSDAGHVPKGERSMAVIRSWFNICIGMGISFTFNWFKYAKLLKPHVDSSQLLLIMQLQVLPVFYTLVPSFEWYSRLLQSYMLIQVVLHVVFHEQH